VFLILIVEFATITRNEKGTVVYGELTRKQLDTLLEKHKEQMVGGEKE
jgi:hypothetical protein